MLLELHFSLHFLVHFSQGTFLVGQPAQGSGKQGSSSSAGHAASSSATVTQQAIRVTAGQKAAILAQVSVGNFCGTAMIWGAGYSVFFSSDLLLCQLTSNLQSSCQISDFRSDGKTFMFSFSL